MTGFEEIYHRFWQAQVREAEGQRLEMLHRDLTGTRKLLETVLLPVLGTLDGLVLEYEMTSLSGVKLYADVFHPSLRVMFEEEHFVTHAERITRDRFAFERAKARSAAVLGYVYFPYSRDELEKKPDFCQRNLYEYIGRFGAADDAGLLKLPVYARELMRFALTRCQPFRIGDVREWLGLERNTCGKIVKSLAVNDYLSAVGGSAKRQFSFRITDKGVALFYGGK